MAYVAIKGGERAIEEAAKVIQLLRSSGEGKQPLNHDTIQNQLHYLHSRVLSEGGLYDEELASLALKQALGDTMEAAYYLRAYRSTRPRLGTTPVMDTSKMRVIRRISSAFKDIPGGQMLGPTPDYMQRLFRFELLDEEPESMRKIAREWFEDIPEDRLPDTFPKVVDNLRKEGYLPPRKDRSHVPFDITREPLVLPLPRSAELAIMARAEAGGLLALAYTNMRGYGDVHPTIAELRVGYQPLEFPHPITGELTQIGEFLMTECEIVASHEVNEDENKAFFTLGYGACFGHNEAKAISMAILDRSLQSGKENGVEHPSQDQEFVLMHIDGIESMGFATHYKMPHYVTFESDMDRLRKSQKEMGQR